MPITDYKIIVGTTVEELTSGVIDGGMVPIGDLDPSTADYALQAAGVGSGVEDFEVVMGETPLLLEAAVNEKIAQGLQPIGGVFHWQRAFLQAVGKPAANSGGSGGGSDLPEGEAFQVLGYDASKVLKPLKSGMAQWLGEDRQIGGGAYDFIPVVYLTGAGQRVSQGVPNLRGLSSAPQAGSVAARDSGGVLSGATATQDTNLPNLKQVREMISAVGGGAGITGGQYQVASFNKDTGAMEAVDFSMKNWTGTDLPRYDAAMEFVPSAQFAAGGASTTQVMRAIDIMPNRFAIALRDDQGRLGVGTASELYHAVNLKQVQDMIAESRKAIEDGIIDIINGAINGASNK